MTFPQAFALSSFDAYPLQAMSLVRPMIGRSGPVLIKANDHRLYVVKTAGNNRHPNMLANEYLGAVVCAAAGLPVAASEMIELSSSFLSRFDLSVPYDGYMHRPEPGLHYASRLIEANPDLAFKIEYLPRNLVRFVRNRRDFLGMYLLDLCFKHRDKRQAVFIKDKGSPASRAVFIDNGHLFGGPSWDVESSVSTPCHSVTSLYDGLLNNRNVSSWLKEFGSKLPSAVERAVKYLPSEWYTGDVNLLQTWIHHRIEILPGLIDEELGRELVFRKHVDATMHVQSTRICQVGP